MVTNYEIVEEISQQVKEDLIHSVDKVTPWFFRALPEFYYQLTSREEQISHLHTVLSLYQITAPSATLTSADGSKITFISVANQPDQLLRFLEQISDKTILSAAFHSALEGNLMIGQFFTTSHKVSPKDKKFQEKLTQIRKGLANLPSYQKKRVERFLSGVNTEYLRGYDVDRILAHIRFYLQIRDYETIYSLDNTRDPRFSRVSLCTVNPPEKGYLLQVIKIFERKKFQINRLYLNTINPSDDERIVIITIYGIDQKGNKISPKSDFWNHIKTNVKRVKWVIEDELSHLMSYEDLKFSIEKVNFLRAAATFVHQFLSKIQVERYTYEVIKKTYLQHPKIAAQIVDYFYARFDPSIEDVCHHCGTDLQERERRQKKLKKEILESIEKQVEHEVQKEIFQATLRFIDHILKTNYFIEDNIGLSFRMDPKVLDPNIYKPLPYGFFFFFGRGYKGYHVRFEDMARGGLRIVRTRDAEHYDFESVRIFDEVFDLSWAQHLKNKDIPEGGAKGILLLHPQTDLRQSVECLIDSLLDLIVTDEKGAPDPRVVDYYGKEEYIYLGPDENMKDSLIEWIIERAKKRKYKYPNAFMSGKPGVGINHKQYGVTSHGVNVYLENTLKFLGINPHEKEFTVRMVGGPDGDVAGNELKILIESYPYVKILSISDGGGVAYDPNGLDKKEILRLVKESKSIAHFRKEKLSSHPEAFVESVTTPEGRKLRDEFQLTNKFYADVYIPAGGRPRTINSENWNCLLDSYGKPVIKAIVEGANIFLSNEARLRLESRGVLIIRDSSANKGGVICSSYEVLACLLLSEKEFLKIKDQYIQEVIQILKEKAQLESELLFREYNLRNGKVPLTHLSHQISKEINEMTQIIKDCIRDQINGDQGNELFERIMKKHFPPTLVKRYWNRVFTKIPKEHRVAILSTQIASYIVYREGLGWIQSLNYPNIVRIIQVYLEQDKVVSNYIQTILKSNLPGKETIAQILEHNARKELTREVLMGERALKRSLS